MAKADDKKTNKAVAAEKKADDGKLKASADSSIFVRLLYFCVPGNAH